jgi:hypothetical protein
MPTLTSKESKTVLGATDNDCKIEIENIIFKKLLPWFSKRSCSFYLKVLVSAIIIFGANKLKASIGACVKNYLLKPVKEYLLKHISDTIGNTIVNKLKDIREGIKNCALSRFSLGLLSFFNSILSFFKSIILGIYSFCYLWIETIIVSIKVKAIVIAKKVRKGFFLNYQNTEVLISEVREAVMGPLGLEVASRLNETLMEARRIRDQDNMNRIIRGQEDLENDSSYDSS